MLQSVAVTYGVNTYHKQLKVKEIKLTLFLSTPSGWRIGDGGDKTSCTLNLCVSGELHAAVVLSPGIELVGFGRAAETLWTSRPGEGKNFSTCRDMKAWSSSRSRSVISTWRKRFQAPMLYFGLPAANTSHTSLTVTALFVCAIILAEFSDVSSHTVTCNALIPASTTLGSRLEIEVVTSIKIP